MYAGSILLACQLQHWSVHQLLECKGVVASKEPKKSGKAPAREVDVTVTVRLL